MSLQSVILRNYRSYDESSFEFGPGVTIVVGPNASGKTNLLEAVYLLCTGTSFRVSDKDVVRVGKAWSRIDGFFESSERYVKLESNGSRTKKTCAVDGSISSRLSYDLVRPLVLFEPDDMRIVYGSPDRRRLYIDRLLSHSVPGYKKQLLKYTRLLRQRNTLLKSNKPKSSLFAWNVVLAAAAYELTKCRTAIVQTLEREVSSVYESISQTSSLVSLIYQSDTSLENYVHNYTHKLEASYVIDSDRGYTACGPHKDDILISINSRPATINASRGEARTIMLSLKILETLHIERSRGTDALLLLDDVFSELDGTRRRLLTSYLKDRQSIITTTDADIVGKSFVSLSHVIGL
jgi:DNA replication and repair protein RecF